MYARSSCSSVVTINVVHILKPPVSETSKFEKYLLLSLNMGAERTQTSGVPLFKTSPPW